MLICVNNEGRNLERSQMEIKLCKQGTWYITLTNASILNSAMTDGLKITGILCYVHIY